MKGVIVCCWTEEDDPLVFLGNRVLLYGSLQQKIVPAISNEVTDKISKDISGYKLIKVIHIWSYYNTLYTIAQTAVAAGLTEL